MAEALYETLRPIFEEIIDALVRRGMDEREARQSAADNMREWDNGVTGQERAEWVSSTASDWVAADRDRQRGENQASAADRPNSPEARRDVLTLARAMGVPGGYDVSGDQWTDAEREAVREYQRRRGLDVTGSVDQATVSDVREVGRFLASQTRPADAPQGPPGDRVPAFVQGGGQPGVRSGNVTNPVTSISDTPAAGGAGGGATGASAAPPDAGGAPNPDGLFSIPGGAQVWKTPDGWFAVYTVPGTGTPLAWKIDDADLPAIFGPDRPQNPNRTLTAQEWGMAGALVFGSSRMLANTSEHPFDAFVANFQTEANIRPWLRDPEILALTTRALLENRSVTEAELAGTDWWQGHTEGERAWIAKFNKDPLTAQGEIRDKRAVIQQRMIQAGISNAPESLANLIADRVTGGTWTEAYAMQQIVKLADPAAAGSIDATLARWVTDLADGGITLDTLTGNVSKVDDLLRRWLGPVVAQGWSQEQKEMWAGRLRNDPNAEQRFIETVLQPQRLAMFPEYENRDLSYEDIAAPWRSVVTQTWGQQPDETDPLFSQIVRTNDLSLAQQMLRREGRRRNIGTVVDDALRGLGSGFGTGERGVV